MARDEKGSGFTFAIVEEGRDNSFGEKDAGHNIKDDVAETKVVVEK